MMKNGLLTNHLGKSAPFLLLALFLVSCSGDIADKFDALREIEGYKNAILMIGDGMGINHIEATKAYNQQQTIFLQEEALVSGWMKTRSANSDVTDSAAAGTAMATGEKTNNGMLGRTLFKRMTNMSEFAKAYDKGVGILATETLTGATPASFSAHNISRENTDEIAREQFGNDIDVYMGAGKNYYDEQRVPMAQNHLSYYTDFDLLRDDISRSVDDGELRFSRSLSAFETISVADSSTTSSPTLADMAVETIRFLSHKYQEQGFFLMIEGSHIDKRAHAHDLLGTIQQLNGFNQAVEAVVEWAKSDGETFVLTTADHETGGLVYDGETKSELNDEMFTVDGHTGVDVPFYCYSPIDREILDDGEVIDNTDLAQIYRAMIRSR